MINFGLKGIEVYHSSHTEEDIKYYLEIAVECPDKRIRDNAIQLQEQI